MGARAPFRQISHPMCCALLLAAFACRQAPEPPEAPGTQALEDRPDVVFVVLDDLNDWVGYLGGHPQARTPNLDRLAARGVAFTRAHAPAPLCNPSRSAVLTGRSPASTGIYDNRQPLRLALPDALTLPQLFATHGYRTAAAGKVFHDPDPKSWQESVRGLPGPKPAVRPANGLTGAEESFDWGAVEAQPEEAADLKLAAWAAERLGRPRREPLLLALGLGGPHLPWYVPHAVLDAYPPAETALPEVLAGDLDDVPEVARSIARRRGEHALVAEGGAWREAVAAYLASVELTDRALGVLLDAVEASPRAAETVVVVWSDHGFHLGEKEHWRKGTLWEESTRVPLVVAGPGIRPGRVERVVSLLDLFPTLLELAGLPAAPWADGASLLPLLRDPGAPWDRPALIFKRRETAVRTEAYRYVRYRDGSEELYDHRTDPREWHNLAGDPGHRGTVESLLALLPSAPAPPAPWIEARNAEDDAEDEAETRHGQE